jgi:LuxR family maltose regulon positive regulatory protein
MSISENDQSPGSSTPLEDVLADVRATWKASEPSPASEHLELSGNRPDQLSNRELEVLGYLPTMLTASEIATQLYVSVNTIKAHMRSIYRKLGVSRPRDAVVLAYDCGIL